MSAAAPFAVFFGVTAAVGLTLFAYWDSIVAKLVTFVEPYRLVLVRAAIPIKAEELAFMVLCAAVTPWGLLIAFFKPGILIGVLMLLGTSAIAFYGTRTWVDMRVKSRLGAFNNQLEMALRLISGALRVGLGLRQSLVTVVSDMPDPTRVEFSRVLSQTHIGVSIYDALDQLGERMPSSEMTMFTRALRVQSQTGGNLTRVLENLADTIKERRRIGRKIRALTSEAVTTKYIITALPVVVGAFILIFEPDMRYGLLMTTLGRICMGIVVGLLLFGWWLFGKISQLDI